MCVPSLSLSSPARASADGLFSTPSRSCTATTRARTSGAASRRRRSRARGRRTRRPSRSQEAGGSGSTAASTVRRRSLPVALSPSQTFSRTNSSARPAAAPNQNSFYHYHDLWSFSFDTNSWERWEVKTRPSARSGHRMAVYKNFIFLFGVRPAPSPRRSLAARADGARCAQGFQDTGVRTTYLNDLWAWSLTECVDVPLIPALLDRADVSSCLQLPLVQGRVQRGRPQAAVRPLSPTSTSLLLSLADAPLQLPHSARSGFSFLPTPDGLVLHGGYTKTYENRRTTGVALNDTWQLKIPPINEDGVCDFKKFKWEKRKNPGLPPNPTRSGAYLPLSSLPLFRSLVRSTAGCH